MAYKNFTRYVLRAPLFSFSFYEKLTEQAEISEDQFKEIWKDPIIKEAIFLASPSLFSEVEKWNKGEIADKSASEKIQHSVLKYISRMSSRCTPFGLFAGTSVGDFSEETSIKLHDKSKNRRHTRLDMNYLVALSQDIVKDKKIRDQLSFYPNTSIYITGSQMRYVEYTYENSRRIHHIVAVSNSEYLQKVLAKAQNGTALSTLAALLVDDDITIEEARGFIDELVDSQLLVSELEPSVSGPEFLDQLIPVLTRLKGTQTLIDQLESAKAALKELDRGIGNSVQKYRDIGASLEKLGTGFELKYMFQTDMILSAEENTLSAATAHKIRKTLGLLNKMTLQHHETVLSKFSTAFQERYEDKEAPLSKVLDVEQGIGFIQGRDSGDVSPLVDDIVLPGRSGANSAREIKWSPIHAILQKKLLKSVESGETEILLRDSDFDGFEENWDDLPDTMSTIVQIANVNGEEKIIFSSIGGSSAANLLGRFCHGDVDLFKYTQEIVDMEAQMNPDKILAEIIHLPESRVGNILMRPDFRKYEIPYLAKSILPFENQLPLDDLMISYSRNKGIFLRSKKHNKEVLPHLTNAHNFSNNSLPIYQFLASMQLQNVRSGLSFSWGPFMDEYDFLPRVVYNDVILHCAVWNISIDEIDHILKAVKENSTFEKTWKQFVVDKRVSKFVVLVDGDNELLVCTENFTSVKMLLNSIKKRAKFTLKEFLFSEDSVVSSSGKSFTNQVVVSFYNSEKSKNTMSNNG